MPLYEYICRTCKKKFGEVLTVKEHEARKIRCPECKGDDIERVLEPFFAKTAKKSSGW